MEGPSLRHNVYNKFTQVTPEMYVYIKRQYRQLTDLINDRYVLRLLIKIDLRLMNMTPPQSPMPTFKYLNE